MEQPSAHCCIVYLAPTLPFCEQSTFFSGEMMLLPQVISVSYGNPATRGSMRPSLILSRSAQWLQSWAVTCQALLSPGFSRQECWSGLPCPSPGVLPTQGSNSHLLCLLHWQAGSLPLSHLGSSILRWDLSNFKLKFSADAG